MKTKFALLFLAGCGLALAQSSNAYVFVAPGGVTEDGYSDRSLHLGGGGEVILGKGIGLAAELGALGPTGDCFADCALGVFSLNGTYHFRHGSKYKVDPFFTGGYTLLFRNGAAHLANFGGGANYWFSRHVGLRFEFRDHVYTVSPPVHYWGFRFGVAFRPAS